MTPAQLLVSNRFHVYGYVASRAINQDGTGARQHMVHRYTDDEPTAQRWAKELVETGPCQYATWEEN